MLDTLNDIYRSLTQPLMLWTRSEVLSRPCPVPKEAGIYAWFFKEIPSGVPANGSISYSGLTLLYVGISPARPSVVPARNGQSLRSRIRTHYNGNASGSTLRLSLGCLLSDQLDISLQPSSSGKRLTFELGEELLSAWMSENAFVTWYPIERPWEVESQIIRRLNLPLNLEGNQDHPFHPVLSALRKECKKEVRTAQATD